MAVVNPVSGNGRTQKEWPQIREAIKESLSEFDFEFTDGPKDAIAITRQALRDGYEMIVSVGGDGTHNEVVNGFFDGERCINPEAILAFISRGTGSDLIKTLNIPKDTRLSAKLLAGKDSQKVDVGHLIYRSHEGRWDDRYFLNIASFGISGEVDELLSKTTKALGGFTSFLWASLLSIFRHRNKTVVLEIDDESPFEASVVLVAVANGQYFGGGMWLAPMASMEDGFFDIIIARDLNHFEILMLFGKIYRGSHTSHPKVDCLKGKKILAKSEEKVLLDIDGEALGMLPATFEVFPKALRVKIP
jgi:YegS/Rv2252/BmrU family lipid kinase